MHITHSLGKNAGSDDLGREDKNRIIGKEDDGWLNDTSIDASMQLIHLQLPEIGGLQIMFECSKQYNKFKVSQGAKIRNRYNQVPHLTKDTNGKVTNSQLDTTNESQEVSPFPAGDHKAHINRRAQRHSKHKTGQKHKRSTKEVPPWNSQ